MYTLCLHIHKYMTHTYVHYTYVIMEVYTDTVYIFNYCMDGQMYA